MTYTGSDLSICVPMRAESQPCPPLPPGHRLEVSGVPRELIWRWLRRRWEALLPDAEIIEGDSDPGLPFNRAAARNDAVSRATRPLVMLADADTFVSLGQVTEAAARVRHDDAQWVLCYDRYIQLLPETTVDVIARLSPEAELSRPHRVGWSTDCGSAGQMILKRDLYSDLGGHDPRFVGWGREDIAWTMALETMCHGAVRVPGAAYHLAHPRAPDRKRGLYDNAWLFDQYQAAHYDCEAMRTLIAARG